MMLLVALAGTVKMAFLGSSIALELTKSLPGSALRPNARWVWAETRPFYLPAVVFGIAHTAYQGELRGLEIFFAFCGLVSWWLLKDVDDNDDRWKRRRKRLAERVSRVGSRLAVVPASGPA